MTGIFVGTSGWTYDDWQGRFYPPGVRGADRLEYYARHFPAVEVNATFYRPPSQAMINSWNRRLGPSFHLVVKGHRSVTHLKKLAGVEGLVADFLERALALERLQVILWQLPPSLHKDLGRLEGFLELLPAGVRHAVEFRHRSWWDEGTYARLEKFGVAFTAVSHPRLPGEVIPTADFLYLRFHGLGPTLYLYDYSGEELEGWAEKVGPHLAGRTVYAFFNNDYLAYAVNNALVFAKLLKAKLGGSKWQET
ncbi:MAG: DUF72 domain-containing protein [Thermodesulfobacteriota bacterium]